MEIQYLELELSCVNSILLVKFAEFSATYLLQQIYT